MRPVLIFALTAALSVSAYAEEQEWVLRLKQEAKQLTVSLGATTNYGSGGPRIKGSGIAVDKARSVAAFQRVRLDGPVDAVLEPAATESLSVQADDNLEPLITTVHDGDTLVISVRPGNPFSTRLPLRVKIGFRQLQGLELRGSGDATLDRLKGERLQVELSGSGDLRIGLLEVRELQARLSGSGDLSVAGAAEQQDWQLSGSGDAGATALTGRTVRARLSGSGDLSLGVSQELDAQLSGSGDLRYAGRPRVQSRLSGSGELFAR